MIIYRRVQNVSGLLTRVAISVVYNLRTLCHLRINNSGVQRLPRETSPPSRYGFNLFICPFMPRRWLKII